MFARIVQHLRERPQILCLVALVGIASALRAGAPPPKTEAGVAQLLGRATSTRVGADEFVWDRSRGPWLDAFWGRDVLFLGRQGSADGPRDVYRATVRVTREGRPIDLRAAWNLSQTVVGDESALAAHERHVAYVVRAHGAVQAITVLAPRRAESTWSRIASAFSGFRHHGAFTGVSRIEVAFEQPPPSAQIQLRSSPEARDAMLVMALGEPPQPAAVDLASGELVTHPDDRYGVRSWIVPARGEPLAAEALPAPPAAPLPALGDGLGWPPEGSWQAALQEENPRLFRTALSVGDAVVTLVAIDTRRLSLGLLAGFDTPRPSAGARPSGRLPEGADAVARFNGVGDHDGGLVVNRRLLLPPRHDEATVAIDSDGVTRLGRWHTARDELVSLRQAGAPLVSGGKAVAGDGGVASRSALCRTRDGFLIYAASEAISEAALAEALVAAACDDALALSTDAGMIARGALVAGHARPREPSPADAFYLTSRELTPSLGDLPWKPDGGAQPQPTWMPAAFAAQVTLLGTSVALHAIAADRYSWQIRPGEREKAGKTAERELEPAELARAHVAISLGMGWRKDNRRGLVLDGVVALPIRPDLGVVSSDPAGRLAISRSIDDLAPRGDASELPLLAEGGRLRSEAKRLGARHRRGAACLLADRTLLVATSDFDSAEPNTMALLDLGCERIVELNRGKQIQAFVHRAGSDDAPRASYGETVLYGMSGLAEGHARPLSE